MQQTVKNNIQNLKRQAGLTLIELTVVLLILVGLAGLLIPFVTGFVGSTHDSTGTFNSAALDNTIQRHIGQFGGLPNDMESLIQQTAGTGTVSGADCAEVGEVYCEMMNTGFWTPVPVDTGTAGPTTIRANSLAMAGITSVYHMDPNGDNATFRSTEATPTPLAGAPTALAAVAGIDEDGDGIATVEEHLAAAFERPAGDFDSGCYDYIGLGIGDKSTMIGKSMSTAPVHFAQTGAMSAANRYNRFVAVIQVDNNGAAVAPGATDTANSTTYGTPGCPAGMEPAKFVGTVMSMGAGAGHLWGTAHSLAHTWENRSDS